MTWFAKNALRLLKLFLGLQASAIARKTQTLSYNLPFYTIWNYIFIFQYYNKRKLREIDRRIRYLTKLFEVAHKIEYSPEQDGKAYFGAWLELENDAGETIKFRIVGDEEIYGHHDYISLQSPMAKACLGKSVDDEIQVFTPQGKKTWYLNQITYTKAD